MFAEPGWNIEQNAFGGSWSCGQVYVHYPRLLCDWNGIATRTFCQAKVWPGKETRYTHLDAPKNLGLF